MQSVIYTLGFFAEFFADFGISKPVEIVVKHDDFKLGKFTANLFHKLGRIKKKISQIYVCD